MRKFFVLSFGILSLNSFSQNDLQVFNLNVINNTIQLQQQSRAVQTFASNVQIQRTNYKPVNAVKPVNKITRVRAVRRNSNPENKTQQPLPQINFINVPPQINPAVQLANDDQIFQINVLENNLGNSFGNEEMQIQQVSPVQVEESKHFNDPLEGIGFDLNMPKMNVKTRSSSASSESLSVSYKLNHLRSKFLKVNRKMKGKLSFKKRLRIKVDNCFKW